MSVWWDTLGFVEPFDSIPSFRWDHYISNAAFGLHETQVKIHSRDVYSRVETPFWTPIFSSTSRCNALSLWNVQKFVPVISYVLSVQLSYEQQTSLRLLPDNGPLSRSHLPNNPILPKMITVVTPQLSLAPNQRFKVNLVQSVKFFNCSNVKKIKIVVGCRRVNAGTQPLNMNIAPSFLKELRITAMVDCLNSESVSGVRDELGWEERYIWPGTGGVHDSTLLEWIEHFTI